MKVLQTIPYMLASQGGPSTCTCDLMEGLYDIGANTDLLTSGAISENDKVLGDGRPWMKTIVFDYRTPLALSNNTDEFLETSQYDLYHTNTLWLYPVHATCAHARNVGTPYILSTHGMLYPTALAVSSWKKKLMGLFWYNKDIKRASCLHATCDQEAVYNRQWGYKGPIAVIPNAVVFPEGVDIKKDSFRDSKGRRQIGFLGRLHPIKKVENLIYALDKLPDDLKSQISLQIMGKYDDAYEQFLKDEVSRLKLTECVEFVGFVSGKEKYDRLSKLSALMVPSAQENFGMIVPEALICGTPVYASLGTPWGELNDCNAGWWKDNSAETIAEVIKDILSRTDAELLEMGRNGRKLMEDKYEQHKVAGMMKRLYEWILVDKMNFDSKPDFVFFE